MLNYYRRLIKEFSHIAKPLTKLTPLLAEFIWDDECQEAFEKLKHDLMNHVTLKIPDFSQPFYVTTDVSAIACGATLSQRELLAMMMALEAFRPYIYGRKFTIITDHEPLKYLISLKNPNSRLHQYGLDRPGKSNSVADALIRIDWDKHKTLEEVIGEVAEEARAKQAEEETALNRFVEIKNI